MSYPKFERPIATIVVFSYNQENYIRDAIKAAFSQTYSPLEILLSDDHSPDRTFEIMEKMAEEYTGNHSVVLNRNEVNMGIGAHFNRIMNLAAGELVILAAGDDISAPERTSTLVERWLAEGRPSGVSSSGILMNDGGRFFHESSGWGPLRNRRLPGWNLEKVKELRPYELLRHDFFLLGAAAAWSKEVWNLFGELEPGVGNEDLVMTMRAGIDRGFHVVEQPLVHYRHRYLDQPPDYLDLEKRLPKINASLTRALENIQNDGIRAQSLGILDATEEANLRREIAEKIKNLQLRANWWQLGLAERLCLSLHNPFEENMIFRILGLLPLSAYTGIRTLLAKTKRLIRP